MDEVTIFCQPNSWKNCCHAALHDVDPVFRKFSRSEKLTGLVASLGYRKPLPVQSMYIFKVSVYTLPNFWTLSIKHLLYGHAKAHELSSVIKFSDMTYVLYFFFEANRTG